MSKEEYLFSLLNDIEETESLSLTWGITDSFLSFDDIELIIDPTFEQAENVGYPSVTEVVDDLVNKRLIFENPFQSNQYRSRMYETVRLLTNLKQLFPKHDRMNRWREAPNLVSDFRFIRNPRKVVLRDLKVQDIWERIDKKFASKSLVQNLRTLLEVLGIRKLKS